MCLFSCIHMHLDLFQKCFLYQCPLFCQSKRNTGDSFLWFLKKKTMHYTLSRASDVLLLCYSAGFQQVNYYQLILELQYCPADVRHGWSAGIILVGNCSAFILKCIKDTEAWSCLCSSKMPLKFCLPALMASFPQKLVNYLQRTALWICLLR